MNNPPKTLRKFLRHFVMQQKWGFLGYFIFSLAWGLEYSLWPVYFKHFVDAINAVHDKGNIFAELAPILWVGIILRIIIEIMFRIDNLIALRILPRLDVAIHKTMFEYAEQHSYRYFSDNFAGHVANKIGEMSRAGVDLLSALFCFIPSLFLAFIVSCVVMFRLHPLFATILLTWFSIHLIVCFAAAKGISRYSKEHAESRSVLRGKVIDIVNPLY